MTGRALDRSESGRTADAAVATRGWRGRQVVSRAVAEFAVVPLCMMAGFTVLAVASIVADRSSSGWLLDLRHAVGRFIGKQASTSTLQAVATGLVTVTSITFSVLLLAVQQTASNLSPFVFDQFIRRRINQVLLGFFVGLVLYSYIVTAAVQDTTPPIIGAAIATGLTVLSMFFLLVLVYTTIDQMRPATVVRELHDRALDARQREQALIRRTRRSIESQDPVTARYVARLTGYVVGIDLDQLEEALHAVPKAEIRLRVGLGDAVAYGDVIAEVSDDDEQDARQLADRVRAAVRISTKRDIHHDATAAIDELANIAWTSASTSKHNPEVARVVVQSLVDLISRWLDTEPEPSPERLAVVYPDNDLTDVLDALYGVIASAHESLQEPSAAAVLAAYASLLPRSSGQVRDRICQDVERAQRLLERITPSRRLDDARRELARVIESGPDSST